MSGVNLAELDTVDMLDVVHFMLEEDVNYSTAEQAESRSTMRQLLYRELYKREYGYSMGNTAGGAPTSGSTGERRLRDFDVPDEIQYDVKTRAQPSTETKKQPTKPYIRPTVLTDEGINAALKEPPLN